MQINRSEGRRGMYEYFGRGRIWKISCSLFTEHCFSCRETHKEQSFINSCLDYTVNYINTIGRDCNVCCRGPWLLVGGPMTVLSHHVMRMWHYKQWTVVLAPPSVSRLIALCMGVAYTHTHSHSGVSQTSHSHFVQTFILFLHEVIILYSLIWYYRTASRIQRFSLDWWTAWAGFLFQTLMFLWYVHEYQECMSGYFFVL